MPSLTDRAAMGATPVSRLCLGTMMFGDQTDAGEARAILDRFAEAGGNFVDTADAYTAGASERMLGQLIAGRRSDWVIATKLGNPMPGVEGSGGLSARWIDAALDASLSRLGTDSIDLYYLHQDDEVTPLEETIAALGAAIEDGRIKAWGFSNHRAWKIADMIRIADKLGAPRPAAAQPYYHALYRLAEIDYLPACAHFGIALVPYSPLARGVLTGKYVGGVPDGSRAARGDKRLHQTEMRPEIIEAAARIDAHVAPSGRKTADVALQWVLANRAITSVLIGPKSLAQLDGYLSAMDTAFGPEDEDFIASITPAGAVQGRYADPRYPFRGRVIG
jgi:aryl-alcohol dehydrogenase-like predicted oxidoreductase